MRLKCQCCGIESDFENGDAAFTAGWDAPPYFSTHVCCDLCPAVCVVLGKSHARAHALWAANGRPTEFTVEMCGDDDAMISPEDVNAKIEMLRKSFRGID